MVVLTKLISILLCKNNKAILSLIFLASFVKDQDIINKEVVWQSTKIGYFNMDEHTNPSGIL